MSRKVLFVVSEAAPLAKTGGLADVAGALPKALKPLGVETRLLMPAYPGLAEQLTGATVLWSGALHGEAARILGGKAKGLDLLLLDAPGLFARQGGIYAGPDGRDWPDNALRFAALGKAAAEIGFGALSDGWRPEVVHAHDWQGALALAYLDFDGRPRPATAISIHNIAFQGIFDREILPRIGLPEARFTPDDLEYYGRLSFLKAGIVHADAVMTVSPAYARELTTPEFGMGMEGLIRSREADLFGILNGVDLEEWNPETDPRLPEPYSLRKLKGKAAATRALCAELGLEQETGGPLFVVVSRLTWQKGFDLLLGAMPRLLGRGGRLALLGSGESELERAFRDLAERHPGRVAVRIGYDEDLSHRLFGGGEAVLAPSRFEPCGLTQLYGLRYGTLPVVARTGGLSDTVIDANDAALRAGAATGFTHDPNSMEALSLAIGRACDLYARPELWTQTVRRAMGHPVGWTDSAPIYAAHYARLAQGGLRGG
ncbi:glycogen synthase GlgA [Neomegalonema perideroedes]|uniref:glycogen synthase GlgA n=1 Tax=Neomegalonema perideroedes TaxID=217219 RepID=UPI00035D7D9F|nr:glycogen synthase GlgA [Neomegalonema perideroedes]